MKYGNQTNAKHCLPLPLRSPDKEVPKNRNHVLQRASWLKKRLLNNPQMFNDYKKSMQNILENGYAKVAEKRGVYHSVPWRFREKHVAVMADIESMFYQVNVPEKHKDYLQFVWWPGWWRSVEGANRSPDESASIWCIIFTQLLQLCATKTADLYTNQFGEETAHALTRHSYVDDILKSYNKSQNAINATPKVVGMLAAGGLKLTKFHSNGRKTLATIPDGDRSKQLKDVDISTCMIPVERALGMNWCFESDKFTFKIQLKDKPMTRRGILSTISSIYDPFGIAIPYLFE